MNAFIAGIVSIAKALPVVDGWIKMLISEYTKSTIGKIETQYNDKTVQYKAVLRAIKKAETNEDRKALSITLSSLN